MTSEENPTEPSVPAPAPVAFDFGKRKKKKTKKEAPKEEGEKVEEVAPSASEETEDNKEEEKKTEESETAGVATPAASNFYTYEFLAGRIFSMIQSSRPEERTVYKMKPPVVYREGTKKTVWVNFPEICKIMNRSPEHVLSFVLAEVGSTGSIDGNGRLVIKGKFQPKHVENILRHYISIITTNIFNLLGEYVKCHTCKSPETSFKKENRLLFIVCEKCGSSRSVAAIKSGFQATTRASRRAAKA